MNTPLIVGNWKANKTIVEAKEWLKEVSSIKYQVVSGVEVVVCAPYVALSALKEQLLTPNPYTLIPKLGAQDISRFDEGPYTGEITAKMLKELVEYVIIGHSERRKYFWDTEEILKEKAARALEAGLKPIYCISEKAMFIPEGVEIVAYEPLFAVGTGSPDTPENADDVAQEIKKRRKLRVLYGGSIKPGNARDFVQKPNIDGLLIGGASLLASEFSAIIQNAS